MILWTCFHCSDKDQIQGDSEITVVVVLENMQHFQPRHMTWPFFVRALALLAA